MSVSDVLFLLVFLVVCGGLSPLLGRYLDAVFTGKPHPLGFLKRFEFLIYRLCRIDPDRSMTWKEWVRDLVVFGVIGIVVLLGILLGQQWLPLNPRHIPGMTWDLALNTAVSFVTNTNWQAYSGESGLSDFSQMLGLTVQNFISPAVGMAVALALIRALGQRGSRLTGSSVRQGGEGLGNLWADLIRMVLYVLLPLSILVSLVLVSQGVVQNLGGWQPMTSLTGQADLIPGGPAASQIAIKQLGTNGGGFFGVNSLHPFENPTPLSNLVELISILLIPAAIPFLYGRMLGKKREGRMLFGVMAGLFILLLAGTMASEISWGTLEGKDLRISKAQSALWTVATTATSNGSVNAQFDSLSPLTGGSALLNIMLGEVIFGGIGSGLYGMLAFVVLTVFLVGLMVGRSPEFLGKKIEAREVRLAMAVILLPSVGILLMSAWSVLNPEALASRSNFGPHGLSEILYAFSSGFGNNGSAFGGLGANTVFYNLTMTLAMLAGRYGIIIPVLMMAGSFSGKKLVAASDSTFRTDTWVFGFILAFMVVLLGALTHFPALTLGPILDHFLMMKGYTL